MADTLQLEGENASTSLEFLAQPAWLFRGGGTHRESPPLSLGASPFSDFLASRSFSVPPDTSDSELLVSVRLTLRSLTVQLEVLWRASALLPAIGAILLVSG